MTKKATSEKNPLTTVLDELSQHDLTYAHHQNFNIKDFLFYKATGVLAHTICIRGDGTYIPQKIEARLLKEGLVSADGVFSSSTDVYLKGKDRKHSTYVITENILFELGNDSYFVYYDPAKSDMEKIEALKKCVRAELALVPSRKQLFLIEKTNHGYNKVRFDITNPSEDKLDLYYNDDLKIVDRQINMHMLDTNKTGLYIFHGPPGTGKTTFIRHLIANTDRHVLYVPQMLAQHLGEPDFISFMTENSKSILVIEDSEKFIQSRNTGDYSFVANLLNMTDGLLGDCIKMQVICTFNTDLENIDSALLRKGRLIARYEFGKLTVEKSKNLLSTLKLPTKDVHEAMSLAEIFNLKEENDFSIREKKVIGFSSPKKKLAKA